MDRIEKILVFVVVATIVVIVTLALSNSGDEADDSYTSAQFPTSRSGPQAGDLPGGPTIPPDPNGPPTNGEDRSKDPVKVDLDQPVQPRPVSEKPKDEQPGREAIPPKKDPENPNGGSTPGTEPGNKASPKPPVERHWNEWYTVQKDDSLWTISVRIYGHGKYWTVIRDANLDVNPDHLKVGEKLHIPRIQQAARAVREPTLVIPGNSYRYVTIQKGEWVYSVLRRENLQGRYKEILQLNGLDKASASEIKPGFRLKLPAN